MLWYYADFGPTGGPPTLAVKRRQGLLHGDRVRRQRQAGHGRRPHVARRLEEVGSRHDRQPFAPASTPACSCARRRPAPCARTPSSETAAVLALALVLAGCGGGGRRHGTATLWVTRDRGTHVLYAGHGARGLDGDAGARARAEGDDALRRPVRPVDRRARRLARRAARLVLLRQRHRGRPQRRRGDAASRRRRTGGTTARWTGRRRCTCPSSPGRTPSRSCAGRPARRASSARTRASRRRSRRRCTASSTRRRRRATSS